MSESKLEEFAGEKLSTLLLPIGDASLLLPNVAVAEIIPFRHPRPVSGKPMWFHGTFEWRGQEIPLIAYEVLSGERAQPVPRGERIAVMNNFIGDERLPFFALVMTGLPKLLRILPEEIHRLDGDEATDYELQHVVADRHSAVIPNLEALQQAVLSQLG